MMIKLENVSKYYQSQDNVSVGMKHVHLTFDIGEFVAITGESGSGKSTLLNVISGLDKYEDGEMYIMGEETSHFTVKEFETYRAQYIGFVFQNYNIIDSYTVYQNVLLALEFQGFNKKTRKQRALELIDKVGLKKQTHQKASKLSGGQKQRAVIARALAKDTPILVCDEPTGNLDQVSAKSIMSLLHEVSKDKLVIVVTHEYDQVAPYATRRIKMSDGEVVEDIQIKKHVETEPNLTVRNEKTKQFRNVFNMAFRTLFSQPKRFIFMLLLLTVVISVFTVVYSNQIYSIRTTGLEQSNLFPSVPQSRVLVERRDGQSLTPSEIAYLESLQGVKEVYGYGALFLNQSRILLSSGTTQDFYEDIIYIEYIDTADILKESDLISGRLPVEENEIVINDFYDYMQRQPSENVSYQAYFQDSFWDREFDINSLGSFVIVGTTNVGDGNTVYLSNAYLNQPYPTEKVEDLLYKLSLLNVIRNNISFTYEGQDIYVLKSYDTTQYDLLLHDLYIASSYQENLTITFKTMAMNNEIISITKTINVSFNDVAFSSYAFASNTLFDTLIEEFLVLLEDEYMRFPSTIVSVSVVNQLSGQKLVSSLDNEIYKVYYPASIASSFQEFFAFLLTVFAFIILVILGLFLYAIIHAVTRNMMQSRLKDFSIFRSVGAHENTLSILVIIEQMILSTFGLVLSITILNLITLYIPNNGLTIEYMGFIDYMLLTLFIMTFSIWLGLRFNRKIFKLTVIQSLTNGGNQ